jgi:hypothetical protein
VKTCVDNQTARAERQRLQISEPSNPISFIGSELVGQLLGV